MPDSETEPEVNGGRRTVFIVATALFTFGFVLHIWQSLYWCNRLWSRRGEFGFVGRHKTLIWWFVLSFLMWGATRVVSTWLNAFQMYDKEGSLTAQVLTKVTSVLTIVAFTLAAVFFSLRFWIIFYDCSLAAANSDQQWVTLITAPVSFKPKIICNVAEITYEDIHGRADDNDRDSSMMTRTVTRYGASNPRNTQRLTFKTRDSSNLLQFSVHSSQSTRMMGDDTYDWFFIKKSTYGNRRWLEYRMSWMLVIVILIVSVPSVMDKPKEMFALSRLLWFLVMVTSVSIPLAIRLNFPEFTDSIKVLKEYELTLSVGLATLILFILAAAVELGIRASFKERSQVNQNTWDNQMTVKFWWGLLSNAVLISVATLISLIQTKYVCLSFVHTEQSSFNEAVDLNFWTAMIIPPCLQGCCDSSKNSQSVDDVVDDAEIKQSLRKIPKVATVLADETGFHQFMTHLFNEFSYESLLCVVELQQFKTKYRTHLWSQTSSSLNDSLYGSDTIHGVEDEESVMEGKPMIEESESSRLRSMDKFLSSVSHLGSAIGFGRVDTASLRSNDPDSGVHLPESVRKLQSSIVWHRTLSKEQIFCVLCKKYILQDAEMSVNISHGTRAMLVRIYEVLTKGVLPKNESPPSMAQFDQFKADLQVNHAVFDRAVNELMKLMRDSLSRFCNTEEFQTLKLRLDEKEKLATLSAIEISMDEV